MATHEEGRFAGEGGVEIYWQAWLPEGGPRAVIVLAHGASEHSGRYAWTGREMDVETDLQYNRARYYDSTTGRWISQDPLGFDAGDSNLYRYVKNRPIVDSDPSGLSGPGPLPGGGPRPGSETSTFRGR